MSSRTIRKVRGEMRGPLSQPNDDEDLEEGTPGSRPKQNLFALLNSTEEAAAEDDDRPESEDDHAYEAPPPSSSDKSKKKKAKGKKAVPKAHRPQQQDEDDLDILLSQSARPAPAPSAPGAQQPAERDAMSSVCGLLSVDMKSLSSERELRRLFGSKTVEEGNRAKQARRMVGPRSVHLRKTDIASAKDWWPRMTAGLSMDFVAASNGVQQFCYVQSQSYREVQEQYDAAVSTYDPNALMHIIAYHPYHVDSLLQLSEVYKYSGEMEAASELLHQALYALEYAWHPLFKPSFGNCRLSFDYPLNKALYTALFRRVQLLSRGGCYRSCVETCKLLLALDAQRDPMGALASIDFYAIRARQEEYVLKLAAAGSCRDSNASLPLGDIPLLLRPNFAYSAALAAFHLNPTATPRSLDVFDALAAKYPHLKRLSEVPSRALLYHALLTFPGVLLPLLSKAAVKHESDQRWSGAVKHKMFKDSPRRMPDTLSHLAALFIERSHQLYKAPEVLDWLRDGALACVALSDSRSALVGECRSLCEAQYPPVSHNAFSHLSIADFSDNISTLPIGDMAGPGGAGGNDADPHHFVEGMARRQHQHDVHDEAAAAGGRDAGGGAEGGHEVPLNMNPLLLFIASLLPWNNVPPPPPDLQPTAPLPPPPPPPPPAQQPQLNGTPVAASSSSSGSSGSVSESAAEMLSNLITRRPSELLAALAQLIHLQNTATPPDAQSVPAADSSASSVATERSHEDAGQSIATASSVNTDQGDATAPADGHTDQG